MARRPHGHAEHLGGDRWQLSIELAPDPVTGRRRRSKQNIRAANRRDALDELTRFVAITPRQPPGKHTVDEMCDAWLEHLDVAENTKIEWADSLRRYIRPRIGSRQVASIDIELLDRLWKELQRAGGHDGTALSRATVRKARSALRLAFAQALRWRWVDTNPVTEARIAKTSNPPKVNAPDPVDVARVSAAIITLDADLAAWLRLVAHTGVRKEEGLGWRWSSFDLDAGTVAIRTVVTKAGARMVIVDHPKNASSVRTIAVGATHVIALKAMRARHMEKAISVGAPWNENRFVLSPDPVGERPYYPTSINRRLRTLEKRHKLPHVTIRQLRHHMATQAIARGHDVRSVAGRGGWENPDVLLRVYADWVPARDRAIADDLDADAV